jgi:hypothetical protein
MVVGAFIGLLGCDAALSRGNTRALLHERDSNFGGSVEIRILGSSSFRCHSQVNEPSQALRRDSSGAVVSTMQYGSGTQCASRVEVRVVGAKSVALPNKLPEKDGRAIGTAQYKTAPMSHRSIDKAIAVLVARPIRRSAYLPSINVNLITGHARECSSTAVAGLVATVNQPNADTKVSTVGFDLMLPGRGGEKIRSN